MLGKHVYDPNFANSSSFLKRTLAGEHGISSGYCVDIPCGNGRNIFLLASYFRNVIGIDINETYLKEVEQNAAVYGGLPGSISTRQMDLTTEFPEDIGYADLISSVHYYDYSFVSKVITEMKVGAFFYLESPSCAGENFWNLPSMREIEFLLKGMEVFLLETRICNSRGQNINAVAFKFLLKKANAAI